MWRIAFCQGRFIGIRRAAQGALGGGVAGGGGLDLIGGHHAQDVGVPPSQEMQAQLIGVHRLDQAEEALDVVVATRIHGQAQHVVPEAQRSAGEAADGDGIGAEVPLFVTDQVGADLVCRMALVVEECPQRREQLEGGTHGHMDAGRLLRHPCRTGVHERER